MKFLLPFSLLLLLPTFLTNSQLHHSDSDQIRILISIIKFNNLAHFFWPYSYSLGNWPNYIACQKLALFPSDRRYNVSFLSNFFRLHNFCFQNSIWCGSKSRKPKTVFFYFICIQNELKNVWDESIC